MVHVKLRKELKRKKAQIRHNQVTVRKIKRLLTKEKSIRHQARKVL
jgi:hypothetical protein